MANFQNTLQACTHPVLSFPTVPISGSSLVREAVATLVVVRRLLTCCGVLQASVSPHINGEERDLDYVVILFCTEQPLTPQVRN